MLSKFIMSDDYNASSIKILSREQAGSLFLFEQVDRLAIKYPSTPREFIGRLLEAAAVTNTPLEPIEQRYLVGNKAVPKIPEVEAALLHILDQTRWR
ncbi:MAG: hypothetical protein IPM37_03705 [Hahellaceae bacterium]|nr:hypothetical protein [Hahellaceae bacterium]